MRPARERGREVEAGRKVLAAAAAGAEVAAKEEAMARERGRGMEDEVRRILWGRRGGEEDGVRDKPRDAAIGGSSPGNPGPLDTPSFFFVK
jgi:hypothetical protein